MIFCYDCATELITFDFFSWLVQVKAKGATEIVFDTRGLPRHARKKFETIIQPGPALAELPSREGVDGERLPPGSSRMGRLVQHCRTAGPVPRLVSVRGKAAALYTVTLRQTIHSPNRNSNLEAWRSFAQEIDATVIEDYDVQPIDLYERVALYAGARLNLGVWGGPLALCTLTPYPVLAFAAGRGKWEIVMTKYGVPRGSNVPWAADNQTVLWDDDDLPTIRRRFAEWSESNVSTTS